MKNKIIIILFLFIGLSSINASATIYYVRMGGSTNTNCTGTTNADYPGSGTGQACAFNHPFWANTPTSSAVNTTTALSANDTLVIVNGSYRIGCQNGSTCADSSVNVARSQCNETASYDCYPTALPNNVTVIGCTTSGCGCTYSWGGQVTCSTTRPTLWGAGNVREVINVNGSSGVTIKDIEITDHANCNNFGSPFSDTWTCRNAGDMNNPNGLAAQFGIDATSATNLTLTGVNLHSVGYEGIRVKNVNGMTITGSNNNYNTVGISNDDTGSCTTCGLSGTITIDKSQMNWQGCIEDWQHPGTIIDHTCCSQSQGCSSAEAISMANTGGNWILTDSDFSYNTADNVDLLYLNRGIYAGLGSLVAKRIRAEGAPGNSIKGPNNMYVEDSFLIGNCGFFDGLVRTYDNSTFDHCRSNTGNPVAIEWKSGDSSNPTLYNNTIVSNSDVVVETSQACTTGIDVIAQGNIFVGGYQFNDDSGNPLYPGGGNDKTSIYYDSGTDGNGLGCDADFVEDYNTFVGDFKEGDPHTGAHSVYTSSYSNVFTGTLKQGPYSSPGYYGSENYNSLMTLKSGSTALDVSNEQGADSLDFNSYDRGAAWDGGAVEFIPSSTSTKEIKGAIRIKGALRL